jgi:hypothetical protein
MQYTQANILVIGIALLDGIEKVAYLKPTIDLANVLHRPVEITGAERNFLTNNRV